jgi:hypothetical protein
MATAAPEAIQAREDSRRACLRIRCRRGCMPEGYAQRGGPARVFGVRRLRLDVRFGSHNCPMSGSAEPIAVESQTTVTKPAWWPILRFKGSGPDQDPPHEVTTVIVPPSAETIFPPDRSTEAAPFVVLNVPQ